ncbi:PRE_C2HC domain-containing protein [Trichonephila clavipes]|nr:PRE_C2HC domain-containing protein [Trichonephila clavipes]
MRTWRNLSGRAKLESFLVANLATLATILASLAIMLASLAIMLARCPPVWRGVDFDHDTLRVDLGVEVCGRVIYTVCTDSTIICKNGERYRAALLRQPSPRIPPSNRASDFSSPYQGFIDKADSIYSLPFSGNGKDSDMANLPTDMELEQASTQRTLSRTPSPQPQLTPCEQLKFNKAQLAKMEAFRKSKQACVDTLRQMPDHYPDEPFYRRAVTELQDIEETMAIATTPKSNTQNIKPCKRKDNSNFEYPPQRKTARKIVLDFPDNEEINLSPNKFEFPQRFNSNNLENPGSPVIEKNPTSPRTENRNIESNNSTNQSTTQNPLPPPIMLFVEENYKTQMAAITKVFPKIRSRLTGDFLKLYTDTPEGRRLVVQLLKKLKFQFYTIKAKADRPIKVVIKDLPRTTKPEEIKEDLELLDYTPERLNQLVGRKSKRALPIFLITLPRNLDNLKIFDLKTLSF